MSNKESVSPFTPHATPICIICCFVRYILIRSQHVKAYSIWRKFSTDAAYINQYQNPAFFFYHGETVRSRSRSPHYQGSTITLSYTHQTRQDSSGRVISPTQRPLPDNTRHSQDTDIHDPGGIRNQSQQASSSRPTPQTARPIGSTEFSNQLL